MINRLQIQNIQPWLGKGKALIIIGPRQVGKTTLAKEVLKNKTKNVLWLTGDDPQTRSQLEKASLARLENIILNNKILVIDEAQRIAGAGLMLKLITDHFKNTQLIVTGSSSLDIASQTKESLVGRKFEFPLYPLSFVEMVKHHGLIKEQSLLEHRLIYGYYPEVVQNSPAIARKILFDLSDGLMYKDLLTLDQIKKPSLIIKLLQALALQIGAEVKYTELAEMTAADPATVEKYIDLLEKSYVVFRLPSLSRNVRNEIKKGKKVYFYDNGIRNAIIKNFNPVGSRQDIGALWENFLVTERMKHNTYSEHYYNAFFWRTTAQQEIDYIEESGGQLHAFEFKWNPKRKGRIPLTFKKAYPNSETEIINRDNFENFVGLNL